MNNQQFRRLVLDTPTRRDALPLPPCPEATASPSAPTLGSRTHTSIPMTPRQVGRNSVNVDFARQLAERNAKVVPAKRFRSSAPKGIKLAAGYTDRTQSRVDDEEDERAQRIKALAELMKLGQIDREEFEKQVEGITGGDIDATHLVRGLDRKLLERVRKGEDIYVLPPNEKKSAKLTPNADDEFDHLAQQEIAPIARENAEKRGEIAPLPPVVGVKRTRDAILAELKAQRKAAAEAATAKRQVQYPSLGLGFRKVSAQEATSRIEMDEKGREVLIITDANGKEKRKVKKQRFKDQPALEIDYGLNNPRTLNGHIALPPEKKDEDNEDEDEDIFEGVGSNYNPLQSIVAHDDSLSEDDPEPKLAIKVQAEPGDGEKIESKTPSTIVNKPAEVPRRNYFKDTPSTAATTASSADATVFATLHKVRALDPNSSLLQDDEEERLKKRAAMLAARDRDLEDLDMGFGASRFDDAEEMERESEKVRLFEWKGLDTGDEDENVHEARGGKKRKRGPKKRKGDKNNTSDILKVMKRQKGSETPS
ncbi:hypothetical protein CC78DRAFT_537518 [Lojkania enalia]|uniref:RED-like N-terminal domain-containing protein n=1 Tax=Lojkania enalia TaxID=147567 RepID=A0A9P4MY22_9PLEO|nr:hypothetical protein CC78DRAFT_537518 [Didymosphaeria enalia]